MKPIPQRSISVGTRLATGTTLLVTAIAVVVYVGLTRFQWHTLVAGKSATATVVGELFREVISTAIIFDDSKGIDEAIHSLMTNDDVLYVRIDKLKGRTITDLVAESRRPGFAAPVEAQWEGTTAVLNRGAFLILNDSIKDTEGQVVARALVAFSLTEEQAAYQALKRRILLTALATAVALILLLVWMARVLIVRPMKRLMHTATQLREGQKVTSGITSADEVGALGRALDTMAQVVWEREATVAQRTQELSASREQFRALLETCRVIPFRMQGSMDFSYVGPQAEKLLGYPHAKWLEPGFFADLVYKSDREAVLKLCADSLSMLAESEADFRLTAADGRIVWVHALLAGAGDGLPGLGGFFFDVTKQKKLEEDLRQAQKLESVGRLASGVAHEINTPVQFVNDSVTFVKDATLDVFRLLTRYREIVIALPPDRPERREMLELEEKIDLAYLEDRLPKAIDRSIEGLGRIATIVQSMKDFAHPDSVDKVFVDLNKSILSTLVIARNEYRYVADLETDLGEVGQVYCFAGELNQVVLNVVVNAAHAIADVVGTSGQRGRIRVRTAREDAGVLIAISDTGNGIPAQVQERMFDPFFTTKEVGKGTGQGLAIARSVVVDKHHGQLTFETELGKGTTFFIRIPDKNKTLEAAA